MGIRYSLDKSQCNQLWPGLESRGMKVEVKKRVPDLLKLMPVSVQGRVVATTLNRLLRGQSLRMRLGELQGRTVSVCISDIPWQMDFLIRDRNIRAAAAGIVPDVTISGTLRDYLELLKGDADPDALFFQRRLTMEGDTGAGVHLKNLLDSLEYDWDAHYDAVLTPALADRAKRWRPKIYGWFNKDSSCNYP